ncbi:hypothetical protein [Undibacterium parvum]|uniref:Uncharacterized protein n=2 Tax=Undibacterium TaxID=401469 RepID=A0A6M4A7R5_9BURK|nr:hypothetical protein [Undibacterium parvum]AZP12549.1 hypothetical protein EJN92_11355 [Undibacterium parvum]QJQ06770.1 hypothetical protein EJG51_013990 [Undibacterium piscinae]
MRHHVFKFLVLIVALLSAFALQAAEFDAHFLTYDHMSCPSEQDVAELAAIHDDMELRPALERKVLSGACTAPKIAMRQIVQLTKRTTVGRGFYYCFKGVEFEVVSYDPLSLVEVIRDEIECAPAFFVTTLRTELARRKGDFVIKGEGPFAVKARCVEGGTVSLHKRDGDWWRSSEVFPLVRHEINVGQADVAIAIRDGCKGVDVDQTSNPSLRSG